MAMREKDKAKALFILCWVVYFASYLGRLNYTSVMPEMIAVGLLTKPQAGMLGTAYLVFYAVGQVVSGVLGDRVSPVRMIALGTLSSALTNMLFGLCGTYPAMLALRCAVGFSSSMLWPPVLRLFAERMNEEDRVRYSIHMSSAVAGGTLGAYLLAAAMLRLFGWRTAFFASAGVLAVVGIVWIRYFRGDENSPLAPVVQDGEVAQQQLSFWRMLLIPGILVALFPTIAHGALKDGMTAWVPTFIAEAFSVPPTLAPVLSTVLPIVNLSGALAAQFVYRRMGRNELSASGLFLALAALSLVGMRFFAAQSLVLTLALLAVVTSSMLAVNTLLVVLPMRFGQYGRVATLSGLLNAMAYGGSAVTSAAIGFIVEGRGWGAAIESWILLAAAAAVLCIAGHRARFDPRPPAA